MQRLSGCTGNRSVLWLVRLIVLADAAGLAMARSRAGMAFAIVALIGIVSMAFKQTRATEKTRRHTSSSRISLAAAVFAVLFAAQFGLGSMLSRFEGDPLEDLRFALNQTTFETAIKPALWHRAWVLCSCLRNCREERGCFCRFCEPGPQ